MTNLVLKIVLVLCICSVTHVGAQEKNGATQKHKTIVNETIDRLTKLQGDYYNKGEYERFKIFTDSILHIARKNNLKEIEIDAITRLGIYYKKKAEYDKALNYYLQSLELVTSIPESYKRRTVILINLGNIYNEIGYHNKAKLVFEEALGYINKHEGPDIYRMATYSGLGELTVANTKYKEALEYFKKSKEIGEKLKRNDIIVSALNSIADSYYQLKQYEQSVKYSEEALTLNDQKLSKELNASTHYNMGSALIKLNRLEEAEKPLQVALGLAFTYEYRRTEMYTHKKLAYIYDKLGRFEKAVNHQKGHDRVKGLYYNSLSKAKRLETEIEIKKIEEDLREISREKKILYLSSIIFISILLCVLFYYLRKNKRVSQEAEQLKKDRILLRNENETLKTNLQILAKQNLALSSSKEKTQIPYQKSLLSQKDREIYMKKILDYMDNEKPYLDFEIKQSDIAKNLSMTIHQFSEVLNVCLEKNFNSFINLYRVNEAKNLIKNPKYKDFKILAIGYEAGFNSKTSFNRVFKQLVGKTPSEYREESLKLITL